MKSNVLLVGALYFVIVVVCTAALYYASWLLYTHILVAKFHCPYLTYWDVVRLWVLIAGLWVLIAEISTCFRKADKK